MQVSRKTRSSDASQVEADVKAVGREHSTIEMGHRPQLVLALEELGIIEFVEAPFVSQRSHEQVAVVVREPIEHDEGRLAAKDDEILVVMAWVLSIAAQETVFAVRGLIPRIDDVGKPPRCPELIVRHCFSPRFVSTGAVEWAILPTPPCGKHWVA
jgi:hypothetical protein